MELEQFFAQVKAMSAHVDHLRRGHGKASESHRWRLDETAVALDTSMEELRAAEEELRQQSEELELSRLEVELERRRYRDLFDFAPDGYLVTDKHGKILEANRAAAALLGLPQRFLAGNPLANYVADKDRRTFRLQLAQLSEVGRRADWDLRIRPPRREAFEAALSVAVVRDREGEPVSLRRLMHDITERKRVEEQVRTLNAELECRVRHRTEELETALADVSYLHEVATRLSGSLELEPLLEEILAVVARFVGAERGALLLCDGGSDELALLASIGLTEAFTGQLGRIPRDARPWWPVLGTRRAGHCLGRGGGSSLGGVARRDAGWWRPRHFRRPADRPPRRLPGDDRRVLRGVAPATGSPGRPDRAVCTPGGRLHRGGTAAPRATRVRPTPGGIPGDAGA